MGKFALSVQDSIKRAGSKCEVGRALKELTGEDLSDLTDALAQPAHLVPHAAIMRALRAEGYKVGDNGVNNHRAGGCSCGPHR